MKRLEEHTGESILPFIEYKRSYAQSNFISDYNAFKGNGVYLVVIGGSVKVNDISLGKRDALGISDTDSFSITASEDAEMLAVEIPMN